jgi:hypothetical protein
MWEPVLERWPFILEIDFQSTHEYKKKIDIVAEKAALNLDISDELLQVLLTTSYDWGKKFEEIPKMVEDSRKTPYGEVRDTRTRTMTTMSKKLLDFLSRDENNNEVEYVSPCTIWNDTGYPMQIEPVVYGKSTKKTEFDPNLSLDPGEERDLLMESSIDKIFESSTNQNVLEKMLANVSIDIAGEKCSIHNIDIYNLGTKRNRINLITQKVQLPFICNVFNYKNKKLVRFSSTVVIKNELNLDIVVEIHEENAPSSFMTIKPHSSKAVPIDKLNNLISFHGSTTHNDVNFPCYKACSLDKHDQVEVKLGSCYAILRAHEFRAYALIFVEPIITLKNCLPFRVGVELRGKDRQTDETVSKRLDTQEQI